VKPNIYPFVGNTLLIHCLAVIQSFRPVSTRWFRVSAVFFVIKQQTLLAAKSIAGSSVTKEVSIMVEAQVPHLSEKPVMLLLPVKLL
jgi:hypothetical protein|tara:strand:- start:155 stop:415 length:261 start_codon:yes stop_codon:yes gene_type:complete